MEYWKASEDVHKTVTELIGQYHPDLALISEEIVVVFREKARKSGGQIVYGTARRSSPVTNALSGEDTKFILEVGADRWENDLTSRQREALLDSLLCACRAEDDGKNPDLKLSIARPDRAVFLENVERYGMWFPKPESEEEGDGTAKIDALIAEDGS